MRIPATCLALGLLLAGSLPPAGAAPLIADHRAADAFDEIPAPYFQSVRDHYRFFYGRTSHGSQIGAGIDMLAVQDPVLFADVTMAEFSIDLGYDGDTTFVPFTRDYLAAHPECNAVMWAWCGGVSVNTPAGIDAYLQAMHRLEADYPNVLFIYMTGHLDGTGEDGQLRQNNARIREWCVANDKVLYDFADIESFDPDGVYHPDESDACGWCEDWCAAHGCPPCADCAHSHCFNCFRKARAFWWMMARARGWEPGQYAGGTGDLGRTLPAYPNPFRHTTTLAFWLTEPGAVQLRIVDIAGRALATLADAWLPAGRHEFTWDARSADGVRVAAGVYFARFTGPGRVRTERIVLAR